MVDTKKLSKKITKKNKQKRINYKSKPNFFITPPKLIPIK